MNIRLYVLLVIIICFIQLTAAPGCMGARVRNGITGAHDYHSMQPISCNCDCMRIGEGGYCSTCGHIGDEMRGYAYRQGNRYEIPDYSGTFAALVYRGEMER